MARPPARQLALLRDRGKTRWHLPCLHAGLKSIPRERRRPRDAAARLAVQLEAMTAAAEAGLKDHDRWLMTRTPARPKTRRPSRHFKTAGAARLRADPADCLGRHDRGGTRRSRRVPPRTWSPSSACARRPEGDAIGRGGFSEKPRLGWTRFVRNLYRYFGHPIITAAAIKLLDMPERLATLKRTGA